MITVTNIQNGTSKKQQFFTSKVEVVKSYLSDNKIDFSSVDFNKKGSQILVNDDFTCYITI